jgi:hypothetical protein
MDGVGTKFKTRLAFQRLGRQANVKSPNNRQVDRPHHRAERSPSRKNSLFVAYPQVRHAGLSAGKSVRGFSNPHMRKNHDAVFNFARLQSETMVADNNTLTPEQMAARIAELAGRLANSGTLNFKVSEKGAVSVYGLGRFSVALYFEQ